MFILYNGVTQVVFSKKKKLSKKTQTMQCAGRVDEGASSIVVTTALWRDLEGTLVFLSPQRPDIAAASGERGAALEPARKVKFTFPCVFIPPQSS